MSVKKPAKKTKGSVKKSSPKVKKYSVSRISSKLSSVKSSIQKKISDINLLGEPKDKIKKGLVIGTGIAAYLGINAIIALRTRSYFNEAQTLDFRIRKFNSDLQTGKLKDKKEILDCFDKIIKDLESLGGRYNVIIFLLGNSGNFSTAIQHLKMQRRSLEANFVRRKATIKESLDQSLNEIKKFVNSEDKDLFISSMTPSNIRKLKIKYHPDNVSRRFGNLSQEEQTKKTIQYTAISQYLNRIS